MDTEMEFSDGEQTNAKPHVALPSQTPPVYNRANVLAVLGNSPIGIERRHDHEQQQQLPGYIFMCNGRTKTDCFRYRVFGIPRGRKDIVESIKPGMKLFLYDFEKRLLYGVYEATVGGKLDIEPEAFDKKYPAQVGFRIIKNCYPLPENTFKSCIYENYKGSKFKQELSPHQVTLLLSLFRTFTSPELDSLPQRLASRHSAPRTMSFEERFIAATQLRNASSGLDPLSARHPESRFGSLMAHQSVPKASLLQNSYPRQDNYTTPPRESLSLSNLNQPYYPTERLPGDPSRSSIQDPQLKYLTILSNIRRYGSAPEKTASENEYYPATPSEKDQFTSPYSDNKYYSSALSGNEHPSASAVYGSVYRSEFYTSASQKEGEASQQHAVPGGTYYHSEASTVPNTAVSMQPDTQAVSVAQSRTETAGYHAPAHGEAPQRAAEVIGYTHQPPSSAVNYATHSQPGSVEERTQSYAGTVDYTQYQYYTAMGQQTTQPYATATGYVPQPHEAGYAQQTHPASTGYAQQLSDAASNGYTQQSHAAATSYAQQPNYAQQLHAAATLYAQQPNAATTVYAQQPNAAVSAYAQQPNAAASAYAQQLHAAATGYAQQSQAEAVGYTPQQYQAQAVGYTPQYQAQVAGYTQQNVAQGSVTAAPGTTDWNAASQGYAATGDWNSVNQSYYPYTTDASTRYNQTS